MFHTDLVPDSERTGLIGAMPRPFRPYASLMRIDQPVDPSLLDRGKGQPQVGDCLLFAGAETLQIRLQAAQLIPSQFVAMIPYVLTIVAVAGIVGKSTPPSALGRTTE